MRERESAAGRIVRARKVFAEELTRDFPKWRACSLATYYSFIFKEDPLSKMSLPTLFVSNPQGYGHKKKKKKKKTYLSRKEQITRLTTRNIASIRPMVKLQIFNCENSIIKSYLFRCRNSTFFAGVTCDQTKKKLILFSIIKSLKTDTNKSRKI